MTKTFYILMNCLKTKPFVNMGVGSRGATVPLAIFIYDTDKADGGLMVLFFGLVFSAPPYSQ